MVGFFGGVKDKLGFGDQADWQDSDNNQYSDDEYYDGSYEDEGIQYADALSDSDYDYPPDNSNPLSFDSYNPNTFHNVTVNTDRELRVASYDDINDYSSTRARRSATVRNFGSSYNEAGGYSSRYSTEDTSSYGSYSDPYSQFDSDIKQIGRDPSSRIEIVRPSAYADVEKIASSFKAGKTVAIVLSATTADLSKRVLDFSFGVASALNGTVEKEGSKTFIISKMNRELSDEDRSYLREQGAIR